DGQASERPPLALLDLRAADDVVGAVGPAHPRLVAAVVVVAEQDERGRLAHGGARLVALGVQPAPDAHERVAFPFLGHRGGLGVASVRTCRLPTVTVSSGPISPVTPSTRSSGCESTSRSGQRSVSLPSSSTWSWWWWVSSTWVGVMSWRSAAAMSGLTGPPA